MDAYVSTRQTVLYWYIPKRFRYFPTKNFNCYNSLSVNVTSLFIAFTSNPYSHFVIDSMLVSFYLKIVESGDYMKLLNDCLISVMMSSIKFYVLKIKASVSGITHLQVSTVACD